jgi:type VI secretion system protein ImpH
MGTEGRMEAADIERMQVAERLLADPTSFGFFQAIRLLERARPDQAPIGEYADPADEVVRFSVPPSISFPASEIQSLEEQEDGPARMAVNFLGLTGPQGVLPYHYTQLVADRLREKDPTMRDFFDLFHHRMISLFYRAWEKYRFPVAFERNQQDRLTLHLGELIGLGFDKPDEQRWVRRETLLYYASLVASRQRSALACRRCWRTTSRCRWRYSSLWVPGIRWVPRCSASWTIPRRWGPPDWAWGPRWATKCGTSRRGCACALAR